MKINVKAISFLMVVLLVMLSAQLPAQPQNPPANPPAIDKTADDFIPMLRHIPDLSKEQEAKIKELHKNHLKLMLPMKNELNEKEAKLNSLNSAEKPDMKAINALIDEITLLKGKMMKAKNQFMQDVRALLTEDQRLAFDMQHNKRMGKANNCGGNGYRHGHGGGACNHQCNGRGPRN